MSGGTDRTVMRRRGVTRGVLSICGKMKERAARTAGIAAVVAAAATPVRAEEVIFRCMFDWVCDPNRKCQDAAEDVRFRIDLDASSVERIGGASLSQFDLLLGDRALTVLERTISGGVTATTIMIEGDEAVHSTNHIEGRELEPRQYVGQCWPT